MEDPLEDPGRPLEEVEDPWKTPGRPLVGGAGAVIIGCLADLAWLAGLAARQAVQLAGEADSEGVVGHGLASLAG